MSQIIQRQRKTKHPCQGCALRPARCICDLIPRLELRTRVDLIVHYRELKRTTNTGRLAVKALVNSEMWVRGQRGCQLDWSTLLDGSYRPLLFFPAEGAHELSRELLDEDPRPIQLLVPDGNWRQASKVHSRYPALASIKRVKISSPNQADLHLRAETRPEGMSTLQAIAEALKWIEGDEVYEALMTVYRSKLHGTLAGRAGLAASRLP